jgi:multiple sugar transport system permease protein
LKRVAYLLLLPSILLFLAFPFLATYLVGHLSLFDTNYVTTRFVGFGNYVKLLTDPTFWQSMCNAIIYCIAIIPATVMFALILSIGISDYKPRIQNTFRIAFYIPSFAAGVIIANVWKWIFDYRYGLANWLVGLFGIKPVMWLASPAYAMAAVSIMILFSTAGSYLMMYSASIMSIPHEILEQARVDGASWLQTKLKIVVPMIMPTVLLSVVLMMIAVMQMWEFIYQLTYGGPSGGTASPVFDIYLTGFEQGRYGYASAKALILLVVILAMALVKKQIEKAAK